MRLVFAIIGAIIFSLYIVFDTQMMMGGNHKVDLWFRWRASNMWGLLLTINPFAVFPGPRGVCLCCSEPLPGHNQSLPIYSADHRGLKRLGEEFECYQLFLSGRRICIPFLYSFFRLLLTVPNCCITLDVLFCRVLIKSHFFAWLCRVAEYLADWVDDVPPLNLMYKEWIVQCFWYETMTENVIVR